MKHEGQTTSEMMSMARGIVKLPARGAARVIAVQMIRHCSRGPSSFRIGKTASKSVVGAARFDYLIAFRLDERPPHALSQPTSFPADPRADHRPRPGPAPARHGDDGSPWP